MLRPPQDRYPGCACDIPAHIYTYSFRPVRSQFSHWLASKEVRLTYPIYQNPDYSKYYAEVGEIFDYFKSKYIGGLHHQGGMSLTASRV